MPYYKKYNSPTSLNNEKWSNTINNLDTLPLFANPNQGILDFIFNNVDPANLFLNNWNKLQSFDFFNPHSPYNNSLIFQLVKRPIFNCTKLLY